MDKTLSLSAQYTHICSTNETMTIQLDMHANKTTVHDTMRQIRATQSMATDKQFSQNMPQRRLVLLGDDVLHGFPISFFSSELSVMLTQNLPERFSASGPIRLNKKLTTVPVMKHGILQD